MLRFTDGIDLIEASSSSLQEAAQLLNEQGKRLGLVINKAKTQRMVFANDNIVQPVKNDDYTLENVIRFTYLGSVFTYDSDCSQDLWTRIGKAPKKHTENIWKSKNITNNPKNVYWKQHCFQHCYMGVKPGHTTKRSQGQTTGI